MVRAFVYVLTASTLLWTALGDIGTSIPADVSPLTAEKLSGALKGDKEANLVRMKKEPAETTHFPNTHKGIAARTMAGTGGDHHVHGSDYGLDLPPACPRVQEHTDITFKARTQAMDPYGLPCLLEMHWSTEDAPSFDSVHCKRRYMLNGFTDWVCMGYPQLITRFLMIYHIECLDVAPDGTVLDLNPDNIINPSWIPVPNDTYPPGIKLDPGHYCYLRYAIEPNTIWSTARLVTAVVALFGVFFTAIGFVSARSCATVVTNVFYAFAVTSITGISFGIVQFSDYLSNHTLLWLPAANAAVIGLLSICLVIPMIVDACKGEQGRKLMYQDEEDGLLGDDERDEYLSKLEGALDDYDRKEYGGEQDGSGKRPAGPTFHINYDALAHAMSSVNQTGGRTDMELRPRGGMKSVLGMVRADGSGTIPTGVPDESVQGGSTEETKDETKEC